MEFSKIYQNKSNGQKTVSMPKTADLKPGYTALVVSAGNEYEALPAEMQAQQLLGIVRDLLDETEGKLRDHLNQHNTDDRLQELTTVQGIRDIVDAIEGEIHRKYVAGPDEHPPLEQLKEWDEELAEEYTVDGDSAE